LKSENLQKWVLQQSGLIGINGVNEDIIIFENKFLVLSNHGRSTLIQALPEKFIIIRIDYLVKLAETVKKFPCGDRLFETVSTTFLGQAV
jgi:hypothetical protein